MALFPKSASLCAAIFLCLTASTGCVSTPAEKAEADMATFHREATVDKLVERGKAFAAVGDMTRAEEYLAAALEQGAPAKDVVPALLQVCVQTGRYRSAVQHAENHLRKHPTDTNTRFVLGTLYAALGEPKEARSALEEVATLRPDEPRVHYALAVLARDSENDVVAADRHFREYLRLEPEGSHAEEARAALLKRMP
jgi:Flp pilus assembly protein TadD